MQRVSRTKKEQEKVLKELEKGIVRGKKPSFGILEEELAYFDKIKTSLLAKHKGEYVLIKESHVVEILPTGEACYDLGLQLFPNEPMLIKKIQDFERVHSVPYLLIPKNPKKISIVSLNTIAGYFYSSAFFI